MTMTDANELARTAHIRELNDTVRTAEAIGALLANGQLVITRGVAAHGNDFVDRANTFRSRRSVHHTTTRSIELTSFPNAANVLGPPVCIRLQRTIVSELCDVGCTN
jgi:hypothetical protein